MRSETETIYRQKANEVIDHISANLHEPLRLDRLSDRIHVSQRQLPRIMRSALGESLSAYIARQRVERAVLYMQMEPKSLAELSAMVGYDNPQSFSKAFKKQFGLSPKAYMGRLEARLSDYVNLNGTSACDPQSEICELDGQQLIYIRILGRYGETESYETAWAKLVGFLQCNGALSGETRFIGISFDDPNVTSPDLCRFYACASVRKEISPTGEFGTIGLPKGKYAVYTLRGSYSGLQGLYNRIRVRFEHTMRHGMAFEQYLNSPSDTPEENLITKIHIPIQ